MAEVKWTEAQQAAIAARNCRLLVAAAAGSGKTAVLVERIIQRILDTETGVDIDRLMVVTYTEAAASEMRERLGAGLAKRMADLSFQADPKLRKRLKRQMTLLNKATISTMHAFCSKIIRKNFNKVELDPNFRVLDGVESDLLKEEAVEQLLEELYEGRKVLPGLSVEAFETLLDIYGGKQEDGGLKALILHVYQKTSANPFPKQWRDESVAALSPDALTQCGDDFGRTMWGQFVINQLRRELPYWIAQCRKAVEFCNDGENPAYIPTLTYLESFIQTVLDVLESEDGTWDDVQRAVQAYSVGKLSNKTPGCDAILQQKSKEIIDATKDAIDEYRDVYFAKNTEENIKELSEAYPVLQDFCRLVDAFVEVYGEKKRQKGGLDYDDLEHFALKLLTEFPEVAAEMQDFYEEVYIDEYQDANMTQETILSLVIKQKPEQYNLFMVGDIKQSIYGFRQARPDIFLGKYQTFSKQDGAAERLILLDKNFRSRNDVLGSVNYVFPRIMTKEVCGMDYTRAEYLYYGARYDEPSYDISCELLLSDTKEQVNDEIPEKDKLEMEATMIGKRIQELLAEAGGTLQYKDIVILLRATKDKADVFQEVLAGMGVPVFCDINAGFYQSKEGKLILSLLQIIDNPLQDIPLLAVLKSPIGGFTENEIAKMRLQDRNRHLYYNVKSWAEAGNEKAAHFLEQLSAFRSFAVEHDLSELLLELYRKTDYYNYAGVFADGQQRQANLQKIYEEAVKYETQTGGGIFEFLAYVEKIRSGDGDLGGATVLGENDNVVRIMSIHKSKGLEFPVVFLANMEKRFNRMDSNESILMHQDLGFGVEVFDREYRLKCDTVSKFVLKSKKNQEMIAEEIRLLYVAMTRAKEKLILCGLVANVEKTFQKYWDVLSKEKPTLPFRYAMKANTYLDLLLPVVLRHPDLQNARDVAEITNNPLAFFYPGQDEQCRFQFRLISKEELCVAATVADDDSDNAITEWKDSEATPPDVSIAAEVDKRLSATYAFTEATDLPAKISVSQLNHKDDLPQTLQQPHFMEGKRERSAAEWGTITHYILQYIPLDDVRKETVQALCRKQGLTEEEAEQFPWERIADFFQSGVGKRMRNALRVYREKPFTMEVPASQLFAEATESQDTVLVQGIIDCYFEEADGVVILDYKTDRVLPGKAKEAAEAYRLQLELYKSAVEAELGKTVKEKMICFLQTGEFVIQ